MVAPAEKPGNGQEIEKPGEGIRITFANPELLRAYILDPKSATPKNFAERISGIRETNLGEFSLDGRLFKSVRISLIVEPDQSRDPRGARPTAIIRADLQLGEGSANFGKFQLSMLKNEAVGENQDVMSRISHVFNQQISSESEGLQFIQWSVNTGRITRPCSTNDELRKRPMVVLQLWDRDVGLGSISVSLVSDSKYYAAWDERYRNHERMKKDGHEVGEDEPDRWQFINSPVGVDTYDRERFESAIQFCEEAFSRTLSALYQLEERAVPNFSYEIEPPVLFKEDEIITFNDIGGQKKAVDSLRGLAEMEKRSFRLGEVGRSVLLYGPAGTGKSSLVQAFATELGAPLVRKTTRDLPNTATEADVINLIESGHLEAKAAARRSGGGKAVYCLEGLEAFLGSSIRLHDYLVNVMDDAWGKDDEVIVMATSNFPGGLHEGIISRFATIPVLLPNKDGLREILQIHIDRITRILGRNVFGNLDVDKVAQRMYSLKNVSGRDIVKFLSGAYSLSRLQTRELDTDFLLSLLPDDRQLGFGHRTP